MGIERRTCKHLRKLRGDDAETARLGAPLAPARKAAAKDAPALMLAQKWDPEQDDVAGWWMSEKLDGVRALWTGREFLSRNGNRYIAPDWFTDALPGDEHLDGELWVGRGLFQQTISIVRRHDAGEQWRGVEFVMFDAPQIEGDFERRQEYVRTIGAVAPHARHLAQQPCRDVDHLLDELARVEGLGGEGIMLRRPHSAYEAGRGTVLLKVKTFHDAEAKVVGHAPGAGRHKGRLGALEVVALDGTLFSIGTGLSDAERERPPAIGSVVTYRYQELTAGGVPRFPVYVRIRDDFEWPERPVDVARRFELVDESSSKFWELRVVHLADGRVEHQVRYGKIGTDGRTTHKDHADATVAAAAAEKLIAAKRRKGYEEGGW